MISSLPKSCLLQCSLYSLLISQAAAYPFDDSQTDIPETYAVEGIETRTDGTVETYNIPITDWPDEISFSMIRGGDGGRAKAEASIGEDRSAEGGGGALIVASFPIHPTDDNAIRPGGELPRQVGHNQHY